MITRYQGDDLDFTIVVPAALKMILLDIDITVWGRKSQLFKFSLTDKTAENITQLQNVGTGQYFGCVEGDKSETMPIGPVNLEYTYTVTNNLLSDGKEELTERVEIYCLKSRIA